MMIRVVIAVVLLITQQLAFGNTIDFSFNNDAGALKNISPVGSTLPIQGNANFQVGVLANKANNYIFEAGMVVKGEQGEDAGGWLALGTKALVGIIHDYLPGTTQIGESIMIGGELGYIFPTARKFSVAIYDYFGPGATTFSDADRAYQWGMHLDYDLNSGAKIYIEYREADFRMTATRQSATIDSGTYVGIKLSLM
jgi:predicted porin